MSAHASPPALRLSGVTKALGGRRVLDGFELEVGPSRLVVLLGPSGAGKSTVLRIVAGLDDPDEGVVEVGGCVVADPRSRVPSERRGVGMVFQSLELWPHMTAAENLAFGLEGRPRGRAALAHPRVREAAAAVGLDEGLLGRRPPTLSGGERQRVAIARALAPRPTALLYDEPLANLDPESRAEVRRLVRRVREATGTTVLYVTHDPAEAMEVGDEVAVLARGRVVERGPPADVWARPRTLEGARALGAVSALPARRRPDGGVDTPLGPFLVEAGAETGWLLVRPEQVLASPGGSARVVDAHPVPGGWQVCASLGPDGPTVAARAEARPAAGGGVRLEVRGAPVFVARSEDA